MLPSLALFRFGNCIPVLVICRSTQAVRNSYIMGGCNFFPPVVCEHQRGTQRHSLPIMYEQFSPVSKNEKYSVSFKSSGAQRKPNPPFQIWQKLSETQTYLHYNFVSRLTKTLLRNGKKTKFKSFGNCNWKRDQANQNN